MSRYLQLRLHTVLTTAIAMLDLPLDAQHVERLAAEVTPAVKALLTEATAAAEEDAPIRCTVTVDEAVGVETSEYAGCVSRISTDVDHDSPAAALAATLRTAQPDVIITDVPTPTYLGLTVRPQSLTAWHWWLKKLGVAGETVTVQGSTAYAVGELDGVVVQLAGDGVGTLLALRACGRPGLDIVLDSPAGTVAGKLRRQPDVTALEILAAHTVAVTIRQTSLMEWRWWLHQLSVDPGTVVFEGATAIATGSKDGATVHLRGDNVRPLYDDEGAACLMGVIGGTGL